MSHYYSCDDTNVYKMHEHKQLHTIPVILGDTPRFINGGEATAIIYLGWAVIISIKKVWLSKLQNGKQLYICTSDLKYVIIVMINIIIIIVLTSLWLEKYKQLKLVFITQIWLTTYIFTKCIQHTY